MSHARTRVRRALRAVAALVLAAPAAGGCAGSPGVPQRAGSAATAPPVVTLSVVGTSDLHGRLAALPVLGGYLANLRAARRRDGGAVIVLDAGDLFQGTLESNLNEGAPVVAAYNALGYAAAAVGNHEFDYGPVGDAVAPGGGGAQGALRARLSEASFPFLAANLYDATTRELVAWEHAAPATLVAIGGVLVGVVGVTTEDTPNTTAAVNFAGLRVGSALDAVRDQARSLRARGAAVVIAVAHLGGNCRDLRDPHDLASCEPDQEAFRLADALPAGLVDVLVAGHTHAAVAHWVNGVAVIQAWAQGRGFGRVDVRVERATGRVLGRDVYPPRELCVRPPTDQAPCETTPYEGAPVRADPAVASLIAPALATAEALRARTLGVNVAQPVRRDYRAESALGNLVADAMRASAPDADAAVGNAGGVRADLPAGALTYGQVYEALPFDNRLVTLRVRADALAGLIAANLGSISGTVLLAGPRAEATCVAGSLRVRLFDARGGAVPDDAVLRVVTTDFLATGGDGLFRRPDVAAETTLLLRDALETYLRGRGAPLAGDDPALYDPGHPRIAYPGTRPVRCGP